MPVAAPADKRFRRAHVTPKRRRPWLRGVSWRRLVRTAVIIGVGLFGGAKTLEAVLSSAALTVSRISVNGNSRMSRGEVLALLDGLSGQSMVTVDLEVWRQKLLTSRWVADAAVRRVLPATVSVVISERQPLAIGRLGDQLYLLDHRGVIIDDYGPNYAEFDLPIIDGLASRGSETLIDEPRAALAARVLAALQPRPDLLKRVSQVDVADPHDAVILLKEDTVLVRIGEDQFTERLQSYLDLRDALVERIPNIDYVDLRFDDRVYVRPQGTAVVETASKRGRS